MNLYNDSYILLMSFSCVLKQNLDSSLNKTSTEWKKKLFFTMVDPPYWIFDKKQTYLQFRKPPKFLFLSKWHHKHFLVAILKSSFSHLQKKYQEFIEVQAISFPFERSKHKKYSHRNDNFLLFGFRIIREK